MINKPIRLEKICVGCWMGVLFLFAVSIIVRFMSRQILIEKLCWDNTLTRVIWFDNPVTGGFGENQKEINTPIEIEWEELYPFDDSEVRIGALSEPLKGEITEKKNEPKI